MPKRLTREQFVANATATHGSKYDYSETEYLPMPHKVAIRCPEHGVFMQKAGQHIFGKGCPKCANLVKCVAAQDAIRRWDTATYAAECKRLHPALDFSQTVYSTSKDAKATYRCPIHGLRSAFVYSLLKGHGCQRCAATQQLEKHPGWSRSRWIKLAETGTPVLYLIECWDEEERFLKLGITFRPVKERFAGKFMPYQYQILEEITLSGAAAIYELEQSLKRKLKAARYRPKISFNGYTECYKDMGAIKEAINSALSTV